MYKNKVTFMDKSGKFPLMGLFLDTVPRMDEFVSIQYWSFKVIKVEWVPIGSNLDAFVYLDCSRPHPLLDQINEDSSTI